MTDVTAEDGRTEPSSTGKAARRARSLLIRLILTILSLLIAIVISGLRLNEERADESGDDPHPAYALQAACADAGFSSDAQGNCYSADPRGLTDVERAAVVVPAPVPAPSADGPTAPSDGGPEAPEAPVLVVPPAPAGVPDNPRPVSGADPGTADSASPQVPGAVPSPGAEPVAPSVPGSPEAPSAPGSVEVPSTGDTEESDQPVDGSDEPEPVVARDTVHIELPFGLDPDPQPVGMGTTGGVVDVGAASAGCSGWAGSDPDIVLTYTDADGSQAGTSGQPLRIFFEAASVEPFNASIIINDPYGRWWCNEDWADGKPDPMLTFPDAGYGVYDIWVGAPARTTGPGGIVFITERPINPRG